MLKKAVIASLIALIGLSVEALACLSTPVPGSIITSNFGLRFHPVYREWKSHNGMDLRAQMSTPVNAAQGGIVSYAQWMGGGGNTVMIVGSDGIQTRYLHLSSFEVKAGDVVGAGQPIAKSGNTGHASAAPHLHFEARASDGYLKDPRTLMCDTLAEKSDAGPDSGDDKGTPPPAGGGATAGIPAPPFNGYEGMSDQQIMQSEAERRFMNPEWYKELQSTPEEGVRREILAIQALNIWMQQRKAETKERVQILMAAKLAKLSKRDLEPKLATARTAAVKAPN